MRSEYTIQPTRGISIEVVQGARIEVTDIEGQQVADFFAVNPHDPEEFLSTGVTMDCNGSIKIGAGDAVYTNLYRKMFTVLRDDSGVHDLLYPSCRPEMYEFLYKSKPGHPNCLGNINGALAKRGMRGWAEIRPLNLFMRTSVAPDGKVVVEAPTSKPGDTIVLRAEMDVLLGVAACSVSESACNGGKCGPIGIVIHEKGEWEEKS